MIQFDSIKELKQAGFSKICLACGVFDGVHRGHQEIIGSLVAAAKEHGAHPVVFTFSPHPLEILAPHAAPGMICSLPHRLKILQDLGVEAVVVQNFCTTFSEMAPEDFVHNVLMVEGITICSISVGAHWRFGHKAQGDCGLLETLGRDYGFTVRPVPELIDGDSKVSSSRLRDMIRDGDLPGVQSLLNRPYSIYGEVRHGKGIATSELHYPTANVRAENDIFPPCGIFAANAVLRENGQKRVLPGVLYLGNSPTYIDTAPAKPFVEIHIFNFDEDIYGRNLEVEFLDFIRGDEKFSSSDELRLQIGRDIEKARRIHRSSIYSEVSN